MEVAAGFFARVDFATDSKISIPFAKDIARLTRDAVEHPSVVESMRAGTQAAVGNETSRTAPIPPELSPPTEDSAYGDVSTLPYRPTPCLKLRLRLSKLEADLKIVIA
jgi:hypothetical protein